MTAKPPDVDSIREYWDTNTLGLQYVKDASLKPGTPEFFAHIRPWMNPYKFPWIMDRIEREAALLRGKHLLEIGCGMGYDSLEFLKRGVRVTATDLTPNAVQIAKRHFELEKVLDFFQGFRIVEAVHEHHRAIPVRKSGLKAALYTYGFAPLYNLLPEKLALRYAYKLSVTAIKV